MKKILSRLIDENYRYYLVWSYLWIKSDSKNTYQFTLEDLHNRLDIPKATLSRILKHCETWNIEKVYTEVEVINRVYHVKFYDKGKVEKKTYKQLHVNAIEFLKDFYKKHNYDYQKFSNHKRYAILIMDKIQGSMRSRNNEITDETSLIAFEVFFKSIPDWWKQNNFELTSINKHYSKILNQIKAKQHDKYSTAKAHTEQGDYSDLADQ